jgi:hypothetical protein
MMHDRRLFESAVLIAALVFGLMAVAHARRGTANEVLTWNETIGDPTWNSLQNIPPVSQYPSTISLISGAAAAALADALTTDQVAFKVASGSPFPDITRAFTSFSQAAREAADSRVYAGIHFRSACEDGLILGRKVTERTVALYLQPIKK